MRPASLWRLPHSLLLRPLFASGSKWKLPSLDLLEPAEVHSTDDKPLKKMAEDIESALADHGVNVEVADIKSGPRIVRFGLMPGWTEKRGAGKEGAAAPDRSRVKVQNILARERDLSLAISTPSLRFEQVPGEALLGLEVPSPSSQQGNHARGNGLGGLPQNCRQGRDCPLPWARTPAALRWPLTLPACPT